MTEETQIERHTTISVDTEAPEPKELTLDLRVRRHLTVPAFVKLVERALPKGQGMDAERLIWVAITLIETPDDNGNLKLMMCEPGSLRRAIVQCAEVGLEPSIGGQCWIIPRGGKATFQMGALGYIKLAIRAGAKACWADVIYEADVHRVVRGAHPLLEHDITDTWHLPGSNTDYDHKMRFVSKEDGGRGKPLGAYACIEMPDGTVNWSIVTEAELQMARSSGMGKSPAYRNWPDEMRKRTAIARAQKMWPKGEMAAALAIDEQDRVRADLETGLKEIETSGEDVPDKVLEAKSGLDKLVELKKAGLDESGDAVLLGRISVRTAAEVNEAVNREMSGQEQADIEAAERAENEGK